MTPDTLVSENKFDKNLVLYRWVLSLMLITATILCCFAFRGQYVNGFLLYFSFMLLVAATVFFSFLLTMRRITIRASELELNYVVTRRRRSIPLSDIARWTEVQESAKNDRWDALRLYTSSGTLTLRSDAYLNYAALKERITQGIPRDTQKERWLRARGALQLGIAILLFACIALAAAQSPAGPPLYPADTVRLSGPVSHSLHLSSGKGTVWINIGLDNYPDPGFVVRDDNAKLVQGRGLETLGPDDTLTVDILKQDYQEDISHERPAGRWEHIFGPTPIEIIGLRSGSTSYLTLDENNRAALERDIHRARALNIVGMVLLAASVCCFFAYARKLRRNVGRGQQA